MILTEKILITSGSPVDISIYAESNNSDALIEVSEGDSASNGEARVQLKEGYSYQYKISDRNYYLEEINGISARLKVDDCGGRITPGIFVGTLPLKLFSKITGKEAGVLNLEVRSTKTNYRTDYRKMLEDITKVCTDLLMQHSSPVVQNFTPDFSEDSKTLYQQFAFIKSVIDTDEFREAVHRIISSPVTTWKHTEDDADIRKIRRINCAQMRQIASRSNRITLPDAHPLKEKFNSVPRKLTVITKTSTVDTPENRFVKYALEVFRRFCSEIRSRLEKTKGREFYESLLLEKKLNSYLNHSLFKEISSPVTLPLNSPVLQRREGYREVLRTWLMFDLAAKLIWHGGEDVYGAGKRDVAVLYEYWLFFILLRIMEEVFSISHKPVEDLIEKTADGLGLKIKSGKHIAIEGNYNIHGRKLKIEFSYNKTFSGNKDYPEHGSWTKSMRPDYTLSLWPAEFNQSEAEKQEIITHIHFDAKYRVDGLKDIVGENELNDEDLDKEKIQQREGTYKRADLLKMHAYKDAIRRTGGAYVLYPGEKTAKMTGFHEIIPGLGAFPMRPTGAGDDGTEALKDFIIQVAGHLCNRASKHDRLSYRVYEIHEEKINYSVSATVPEKIGEKRVIPPADTYVLVAYFKSAAHYEWIIKSGLYNARIDSDRGSIRLDPEAAGAKYILFHTAGNPLTGDIWEIIEKGPRVFSKQKLIELHYPEPHHENYLVYRIQKIDPVQFSYTNWDVRDLIAFKPGRSSSLPFAVSLAELMYLSKKS